MAISTKVRFKERSGITEVAVSRMVDSREVTKFIAKMFTSETHKQVAESKWRECDRKALAHKGMVAINLRDATRDLSSVSVDNHDYAVSVLTRISPRPCPSARYHI